MSARAPALATTMLASAIAVAVPHAVVTRPVAGATSGASSGAVTRAFAATAAGAVADDPSSPKETRLDGLVARVSARAPARGFEVGSPITCTIEFEGDGAASVSVAPAESLGEFDVLSISPVAAARSGGANTGGAAPTSASTRVAFDIVLSTLASGEVTPDAIEVRWIHDGAERSGKVAFPALRVTSLLGEQIDPSQFRDIAGEIVLVGPLDWWPWAAGAAGLVLAGAVAWWMLRGRPRAPLAPDAWALAEFRRLEGAGLPAQGDFGRYYDELTGIVRRYVALRYAIPADRQTSREFLEATRAHPDFPATEAERLRALLRLADLVKFAKAEPTRAECDANLAEARGFVEHTRPVAADRADAASNGPAAAAPRTEGAR
jgi:hypothetical protein